MKKNELPFLVEFLSKTNGNEIMSSVMENHTNVAFLEVPGKDGEKFADGSDFVSIFVYDKTVTPNPTMKDVISWSLGQIYEKSISSEDITKYCNEIISSKQSYCKEMKLAASQMLSQLNTDTKKIKP